MIKRGGGYYRKPNVTEVVYWIPRIEFLYSTPIQEVFIDISKEHFPEIKDYYMISNYGRLWHKYLADFLAINIDSKGYSYKPLALISGGQRNYRIHQLEMMSFCYIDGCENLLVNHLDLNKQNNLITNLEWTTYSGNTIHAYENNGIDKSKMERFKYGDNELIENICKELEQNYLTAEEIGIKYNVPIDIVYSIKYKKAHRSISDKYNFNTYSINNRQKGPRKIDDDNVIYACNYFQNNEYPSDAIARHKYLVKLLEELGMEVNKTNLRILQRLRSRNSFTNISCNYK